MKYEPEVHNEECPKYYASQVDDACICEEISQAYHDEEVERVVDRDIERRHGWL